MQTILNRAAMANNVAPCFLEYVGFQDERHTVGKVLYHFNIMDPAHQRYKSTVAFQVKADVMRKHDQCIKEVEKAFDSLFGRCDEPLPVSLVRTAAKTIALTYPDNQYRATAIDHIINAARCLKKSEDCDP